MDYQRVVVTDGPNSEVVFLERFAGTLYRVCLPPLLTRSLRYDDLVEVMPGDAPRLAFESRYAVCYLRVYDATVCDVLRERFPNSLIADDGRYATITYLAADTNALARHIAENENRGTLRLLRS